MRLAVAGPRATLAFQADDHAAGDREAGSGPAAGDAAAVLAVALMGVGRELAGSVRVLVLRGDAWSFPAPASHGSSAVSPQAGGSGPEPRTSADSLASTWQQATSWLGDRADLVSVAAVHGPVSGPGLALALACDLRVVTADAAFSLPEAGRGLLPGPGVLARLAELFGYPTALDLCLTGRSLTAPEAAAAGMAQRVVPPAELDAAVESLVAGLLAVPRDVAAETKALLRGASSRGARLDRLAAERAAFARLDAAHPAG